MDKIPGIPDNILLSTVIIVFTSGSVWALAWWLSGQFLDIRNLIYSQIAEVEEAILDKLEYHEKHDDTRFNDLKQDIWDIKLRAASNAAAVRELENGKK